MHSPVAKANINVFLLNGAAKSNVTRSHCTDTCYVRAHVLEIYTTKAEFNLAQIITISRRDTFPNCSAPPPRQK